MNELGVVCGHPKGNRLAVGALLLIDLGDSTRVGDFWMLALLLLFVENHQQGRVPVGLAGIGSLPCLLFQSPPFAIETVHIVLVGSQDNLSKDGGTGLFHNLKLVVVVPHTLDLSLAHGRDRRNLTDALGFRKGNAVFGFGLGRGSCGVGGVCRIGGIRGIRGRIGFIENTPALDRHLCQSSLAG